MCGIFGIYSKKSNLNLINKKSKLALKYLSHRGRDDNGTWCSKNFGFAHTRLSILDLSRNAKQPMICGDDRYIICYNGEIINFLSIKKYLEKKGVTFKTNSDTEVVLELFKRKKFDMFEHLEGMFVFSIYDKLKKKVFLARDHIGIKPVFYTLTNNQFVFSSEIKAIKKVMNIELKISKEKLFEFIVHGNIFGENTIYEKIFKLEPGNIICFHKGKFLKKKYPIKKVEKFTTLNSIKKIVGEWSVSDVKMGALLSGGLDSSLICKFLSLFSKKKISLFTAFFKDLPNLYFNNDLKQSKILIKKIDYKKHFLIPIDNLNLKSKIEKITEHTLEPIHDFNTITFMDICSFIKKKTNHKVIFTGDGADEIFGGYYRHQYIKQKFDHSNQIKDILLSLNYLSVNRLKKISNYKFKLSKKRLKLGKELKNLNKNSLTKVLIHDQKTFLQSYLDRLDRIGMMYGIEIRPPYLDRRIVNFANNINDSKKIIKFNNKNWTKFPLRNLAAKYFGKKFAFENEKIAFSYPIDVFLKSNKSKKFLNYYFNERSKIKKYFSISKIKSLIQDNLDKKDDYSNILTRLLSIEILLRKIN